MSASSPADFAANARAALDDPRLRRALRVMSDTFAERRGAALAEVADWEELRERARRIKDETLADLDRYLAEFTANAERAGARVHRARDAREACAIVGDLVRARGGGPVVKSKSMVTEEIHLNRALEAGGVEVVETDLGEWIVQLAGETPSHIVVPAIHKSKAEIAALFAERLGVPRTDDAAVLAGHARRVLRDRFRSARVGITGVNFAVAETGTIVIIENEGNARLTSSVPGVHVAVMGIEKVIPRFADLDVFLKLLPRSGTGQALTVYQSFITGASPGAEGPEELHLVLLDNGRSGLLGDPVTRQTLACIRCGACLNVCPVYQQVGGHAYGSVYPGPIGAVLTPQLQGLRAAGQLPFASTLCGACRDVCPVKIDIPRVLLHLRARVVGRRDDAAARPPGERMAMRVSTMIFSSPRLYGWVTSLARRLQRIGIRPPVPAWTAGRELRPLADRAFRDWWRERGDTVSSRAERGIGSLMSVSIGAHSSGNPIPRSARDDGGGRIARFQSALERVGGTVTVAADAADAARVVRRIVEGCMASSREINIGVSDSALARTVVLRACPDLAADYDVPVDALFHYDLGVTGAQWAVAETGTLALDSARERHRFLSLVPPLHVAVLEASRLRDTVAEVLAELHTPGQPPSPALTFITGPSRTSDIELTPVVGVHGPGALHVILLENNA